MAFRRFSDTGSFDTYRTAYSAVIDWKSILDEDCFEWLVLYEKGTNCSMNLVMPAIISLTSAICGPKTRVESSGGSFSTTLNQYLISVCDPGGGKTLTFEKVIEPVLEHLYRKTGFKIHIENYTSAGIQRHQNSSNGYGFLASDEGQRFLSSVNLKQMKGEAERSTICKMWNGKGDNTELAGGSRGFKNTSMSICMYIQPRPLLSEMLNLSGSDGFLDRFLILASRPLLHTTSTVFEHFEKLQESRMKGFEGLFGRMFDDHVNGITYGLTVDAQNEYNKVVDSFAESLNERYSLDDENKENEQPMSQVPDLCMTSSKDTIHILRLSAVLYILTKYMSTMLKSEGEMDDGRLSQKLITKDCLQAGRKLYAYLVEHKSAFLQAIRSVQHQETLQPRKVMPFKSRVVRCLCRSNGPYVALRDIQRHLKGSNKESIKVELSALELEGYGRLASIGKPSKELFLKSSPDQIKESGLDVNIADYNVHFFTHNNIDKKLVEKCIGVHPDTNVLQAFL